MLCQRRSLTSAVAIHYAEGPPAGPPFVVLHGGSTRWQYGEAFIRSLTDRWHVYAPDLRGHGRSGRTPGRYQLRDYAADIAAFLQDVVKEPANLYGHSLGGEVAVLVAAQHPRSIRALIVGDAPLSREDHPTEHPGHRAMLLLWRDLAASSRTIDEIAAALRAMPVMPPGATSTRRAGDVFGEDSGWFPFMAESLNQLDPDTLTAVLAGPAVMLQGYDAAVLLPAISCPVLILQADPAAGGVLRDHDVERALDLLPHGVRVRLDGVGHELHGLHPSAVRDAITRFLGDSADP